MAAIDKLRRQRGSIQGSVTAFATFLDNFLDKTQLNLNETLDIEYRLNGIMPSMQQYIEKHQQILDLITTDDEFASEEAKKQKFVDAYFTQIARAKVILIKMSAMTAPSPFSQAPSAGMTSCLGSPRPHSPPPAGSSGQSNTIANNSNNTNHPTASLQNALNSTQNSNMQQIKLPKISLPTFAGNHDDWLEFRDKYLSLLHERTDIDNMQKYHYLRACLTGEASNAIQGLQFTANNYMEAWEILCKRFDNPRVLIHNHVKALFSIETLQRESSEKLRCILDSLIKHIAALDRLKSSQVDLFDVLVTYIITSKFDATTARDWEEALQDKDAIPTIVKLKEFIRDKADLLSTLEMKRTDDKSPKQTNSVNKHTFNSKFVRNYRQNTHSHVINNQSRALKCPICKRDHQLRNCPDILNLSPQDRYIKIKSLNRCINCLCFGHQATTCGASLCRTCGKKHHTILHFAQSTSDSNNANTAHLVSDASQASSSIDKSAVTTAHASTTSCVLLSTALVNANGNGKTLTARVLLDTGSQSSFITESLAKKLNLNLSPVNVTVSGFSGNNSPIKYSCKINISSIHSNFAFRATFLATPRITNQIPLFRINTSHFNLPRNLALADPSFNEPGEIDILLGVEHFYALLSDGQLALGPGQPTLQNSKFGWLVSGMAAGEINYNPRTSCNVSQTLIDNLNRFWEIEELSQECEYSNHPCELLFQQTTKRDHDGRFVVTIPTSNIDALGDSREIALKQFFNLEQSFRRQPQLKESYIAFMKEYLDLGHMSLSLNTNSPIFYLPHHGVRKETSTTTKLRVVYNGSVKPQSGKSLNECQLVGPCVQDDLLSILLRFRKYPIVFTADIVKMYRQIRINPSQKSLQRIFWRFNPNDELQSYDLNTVTYGTASAAYLATRCLVEIAKTLSKSQPEVAERILHDFYVDDLLTGAFSMEEALYLIGAINTALNDACLPLRKWSSNCPQLLHGLHSSDCLNIDISSLDNAPSSTLGLIWDTTNDNLKYRFSPISNASPTKRVILSTISQIFDPLGLLSPLVIIAKIMIQKLWYQKVDWDQSLPNDIQREWISYRNTLPSLNSIVIPRHVLSKNHISVHLHGFCDASIKAYGAAIYLRSADTFGNITCILLCAKAKVAPLKTLTIPRLELCGAYLLARLYDKIIKSLCLSLSSSTLWCDSSIVLTWIRQCPSTLQTFVGNRVSKIQTLAAAAEWRHVPSADNPADLLSRGLTPTELIDNGGPVLIGLLYHPPNGHLTILFAVMF